MAKTNAGLAAYAKYFLGFPYWYGSFGQVANEDIYIMFSRMYPEKYSWAQETYPQQYGKVVHDCVGLIKGYLWKDDFGSAPKRIAAQDKSADDMYGLATIGGPIATIPETSGLCVWKHGHVGVYIGNGKVIEARGHDYGVVETELSKRGWIQWFQCPFISAQEPQNLGYNLFHDYLRKGSQGEQVKALQRLLLADDYPLPKYGVDGEFGSETENAVKLFQSENRLEVDGVVGPLTGAKIFGIE